MSTIPVKQCDEIFGFPDGFVFHLENWICVPEFQWLRVHSVLKGLRFSRVQIGFHIMYASHSLTSVSSRLLIMRTCSNYAWNTSLLRFTSLLCQTWWVMLFATCVWSPFLTLLTEWNRPSVVSSPILWLPHSAYGITLPYPCMAYSHCHQYWSGTYSSAPSTPRSHWTSCLARTTHHLMWLDSSPGHSRAENYTATAVRENLLNFAHVDEPIPHGEVLENSDYPSCSEY